MAVRSTDNNSLFFATALDNSGLKQGTFDALGMIQSFAGKVSKINPFLALSAAAILAFTTIANQAHQLAKEYEHAMKEVSTISDAVQKDFEGMSKKVFSISEISPDDPVKLAKAYYQIVSAGYDGAKGLNVLKTSAKAATAGVTDTETAADGLTTVMNAWKIDASEATTVADSFFTTVKLGKTNFKQLADNIAIVAPIAASANIPLNEIMATVASITKQGTPTSVAMTQVRSAILGMQEAGRLDGTKTLQQNMQSLYETMNGDSTAIREEVGRVEGLNAVLAISGNNAKSAKADLLVYNDTIGATERANKEMLTSNTNQWAIFRNRIKSITYDLGQSMLEMSNSLIGSLNKLLEPRNSLIESYGEEQKELETLKLKLRDTGIPLEERKKLISDIQLKYPKYLSNIENEGKLTGELETQLSNVNDQLVRRARLAANQDKIAEQAVLRDKAEKERNNKNDALREQINKTREGTYILKRDARSEGDLLTQIRSLEKIAGANSPILRLVKNAQAELIGAQRKYIEEQQKLNDLLLIESDTKKGIVDFDLDETSDLNGGKSKGKIENKDDSTFSDHLNLKEDQYEAYKLAVDNKDLELAEKLKRNYSLKEADYITYLRRLYELTTNHENKVAIAKALNSKDKTIHRDSVERINIEKKTISSILDEKRKEAQVKAEVDRESSEKEKENFKNYLEEAKGFNFKNAREFKRFWEARLKEAQGKGLELIDIEKQISEARKDQLISDLNQISSHLQGLSSLFSQFGDDATAGLLGQLSGVAGGVAQIASGDVLGGAISVLDSAITVEVSSDTEKFEKAIKKLEKAIEQLDYVISKSIGEEKVTSRKDAIQELKDLEQQAIKAQEAEKEARKEIKLLGIGVGKKGKGSGTDADKLEELEQKAEEARRKARELREELDEIFTGTSHQSIVDSILNGFKEGKYAAKDFADTFEDLMKGALLESFKMKFLEEQLGGFFKQFSKAVDSEDQLTSVEIEHLQSLYNSILTNAQEGINQMNDVLGENGFGNIGSGNKPGLSGAISTITEVTANILAGTLNSIRIDVSNGLAIAEQSSDYLSQIAQNTSFNHYLENLEGMNTRLANIEDLLG